MDVAGGLYNTAIVVGKRNARTLMYSSVAVALALMVYAVYVQVIPLRIISVPMLIAPIFYFVRPPKTDMRASAHAHVSANVQSQMLVLATITIAYFLISSSFLL